jgi:hypothetical protein
MQEGDQREYERLRHEGRWPEARAHSGSRSGNDFSRAVAVAIKPVMSRGSDCL